MRRRRVRRPRRERKDEKTSPSPSHPIERTREPRGEQGPFYKVGPAINLKVAAHGAVSEEAQEEERMAGPAPTARGEGEPQHHTVFARTSLTLRGRTDADFDGGSFRTENVRVRRAQGCEGCTDECIRVTGMLVATYRVTTTVTLPSVDDFPDLTPCQRRRVQHAIDNVLAPHEQKHVQAFRQYNGTTRRRFDMTLCRSDFDSRIQEMFETEEASRRQTAQAASDALDPFHFEVDLDCEDEEQSDSTAPTAQPAEPES